MGISREQAVVLADECSKAGLVKHDRNSSASVLSHSVTLDRKGWEADNDLTTNADATVEHNFGRGAGRKATTRAR